MLFEPISLLDGVHCGLPLREGAAGAAAETPAAAEEADRARVLYEVQWQAATAAAADALHLRAFPAGAVAVLTGRDASGNLVSQVTSWPA